MDTSPRMGEWRALLFMAVLAIGVDVLAAHAQEPRPLPPRRAEPQRVAPADPYVNLSQLLFRPTQSRGAVIFEEGAPSAETGAPVAGAAIAARPGQRAQAEQRISAGAARRANVAATRGAAVRWNTEAGRRALESRVVVDASLGQPARGAPQRTPSALQGGPGVAREAVCVIPTVTKAGSTCCNYKQPDQLAGVDVWYRQPLKVFGSEEAARDFAAAVRASMPMFLPYHDPDVNAGQGWIYNGDTEKFHGAVDFSQSVDPGDDPAFEVRAIADGVVVAVFWDDWSGNIVTIEHTAPNGDKYRSNYKHLRDGFNHDLAEARGLPKVPANEQFDDGKATSKYKYELFANMDDPSALHWGNRSQTIQVEVGDPVRAGQRIGWSGNTGPGGAGGGLNDDGTPKNPNTANNHLHLMVAVPDPVNSGDWVQVDPYGVYNQIAQSECYDLLDTTAYVRLFAPFYPSFHNVPAQYVGFYWGYYTGMGMGLQTLSVHRRDDEVLASGAFQGGLPPAWYARIYMTPEDYQSWFTEYGDQGFRPREITVTKDGNGKPRFTVIWKKAGEGFTGHHNMTDADWSAKWEEYVVNGDLRVEDRTAYQIGNAVLWTGVFVEDAAGFYELHYMTSEDYNSKAKEYDEQGFKIWSVDPEELSGGIRYGAVWRKLPGSWPARHGMTPAEYQAEFEKWGQQGYRLHRVRGYANSERFAAIWTKP